MKIHFLLKSMCLIALAMCISLIGFSQGKIKIHGIVTDSITEEPMEIVGVFIEELQTGANTNLDGEFAIYVQPGNYTLVVRFSGYKEFRKSIEVAEGSVEFNINIQLSPVSIGLETVVITSDKKSNPALRIIRNASNNRKKNSMDKIDAYEYESYNKLVISMDNVTDKFLDSKMIKNVGEMVKELLDDSLHTDTSKYKIAVFVSESISKLYYKKPEQKKEEIYAVRTSGIKGSEYNLLSSMFLQINIYENSIVILDRQFISPIADGSLLEYDFELVSVEAHEKDTVFGIRLYPKTEFVLGFIGMIYIENHDWAVKRIELEMNKEPNINFVEDIRIRQEYIKVDSFWVPSVLDLEVDFQNSLTKKEGGDGIGIIGRTSTYMYDYKINQPKDPKFYQQELLEIMHDAEDKDSIFWAEKRRSPLDQSEELGYSIVDSLKSRGVLDFYINAVTFLTWGTKKFKYFEIGPYFYLFSFNQAEGWRSRIGIYTLDEFSKKLRFGAHVAYALGDQKFKYFLEAKYRLVRKPKIEIGFLKAYEVEQVGFENFLNNGTSLLQSMLRRVPLTQLNYYHEHKFTVNADIRKGLSGEFWLRSKVFLPASTFIFGFQRDSEPIDRNYNISEAGMNLRISFKEKFIMNSGNKIYIGTKYPIINLGYMKGFEGLLDGEFEYQHVFASAQNFVRIGRYGWIRYQLRAGQVFGTLPYPSLYVFRGNQTWAYDKYGFNMMNYYEFIADQYATLALEHHLEGFILNKIPLIRKWKLKETLTFRAAWGTLTEANEKMNDIAIPVDDGYFIQRAVAPDKIPYMEAGFGIGNIFKVLRIDGIWRLNYHDALRDRTLHRNWGKSNNFGIRIDLAVRF